MKAVVYTRTGGPDVLRLVDKPVGEPAPGEVRVRVYRSGVNPTDWKSRRGGSQPSELSPAQVPNQDGAGVIDAVGQGVAEALLGLRVWIWEAAYQRPEGTAQEYALVPERQVAMLPDSASFDLGASLAIPFMTAHRGLTVAEDGPHDLGPGALQGRTVLIAGGAGAVGNAAIQLARWSDARVITTVSGPAKAQLAAAAGADHVIDYRRQDVVAEIKKIVPDGVHSILEVAPAANLGIDSAVLGSGGLIAIYANNGSDDAQFTIRPLMTTNARLQFVLVYTAPAEAKARAVRDVAAAVQDGAVGIGDRHGLPIHHYPLAETAAAHQAVEDAVTGKVLIDVTD